MARSGIAIAATTTHTTSACHSHCQMSRIIRSGWWTQVLDLASGERQAASVEEMYAEFNERKK